MTFIDLLKTNVSCQRKVPETFFFVPRQTSCRRGRNFMARSSETVTQMFDAGTNNAFFPRPFKSSGRNFMARSSETVTQMFDAGTNNAFFPRPFKSRKTWSMTKFEAVTVWEICLESDKTWKTCLPQVELYQEFCPNLIRLFLTFKTLFWKADCLWTNSPNLPCLLRLWVQMLRVLE